MVNINNNILVAKKNMNSKRQPLLRDDLEKVFL